MNCHDARELFSALIDEMLTRLAAEVRQRSVRAQERLLGDLLGFRPVSQHAKRDAEHSVLVGNHELLEGAAIALAQPDDERRFLLHVRPCAWPRVPGRRQQWPAGSAARASAAIGCQSTSRSS